MYHTISQNPRAYNRKVVTYTFALHLHLLSENLVEIDKILKIRSRCRRVTCISQNPISYTISQNPKAYNRTEVIYTFVLQLLSGNLFEIDKILKIRSRCRRVTCISLNPVSYIISQNPIGLHYIAKPYGVLRSQSNLVDN